MYPTKYHQLKQTELIKINSSFLSTPVQLQYKWCATPVNELNNWSCT